MFAKSYDHFIYNAQLHPKDYQREGVEWCINIEKEKKGVVQGGIIADQMGLGKTATMICTMMVHPVPRTLIVVPPILLEQWKKALKRLANVRARVYHGPTRTQITTQQLIGDYVSKGITVVLTTYGVLTSEHSKEKSLLHNVKWDRAIFDEAHHMRNRPTGVHRAARNLKIKIRWLLSGTPFQNKENDMYNLYEIVGVERKKTRQSNFREMLLKKHFLRRKQSDVADQLSGLGAIISKHVNIAWSNVEREMARTVHQLVQNPTNPGAPGAKLVAMLRARQMCVLPELLINNNTGTVTRSQRELITAASKLRTVAQYIVDNIDNGQGKIVFCSFRGEINALTTMLQEKGVGGDNVHVYSSSDKKRDIKKKVLIIQIQSGYEGLNFQEHYSEIYFVSNHWNPFVEKQAIGRCHRLGQTQPVTVYKFEMNTIDSNTATIEHYMRFIHIIKIRKVKKMMHH